MRSATLLLAFALLPVHVTGQTPSDSLRPFLPLGPAISIPFGSVRSEASLAGVGQQPSRQDDDGIRVSVRLFGGATYLAGGDVNQGVIGFNELQTTILMNEFVVDVQGEVESVHWGFEYGGDVILHVSPRFGVGAGLSRLEASQTSEIVAPDLRFSSLEFQIPNRVEVSAVPIRLGVFYSLPVARRLSVVVNGGVGFYPTDFSWNWRFDRVESGAVTRATEVDTQASGTGVGYHGGVAVEFSLVERVGVFFEGHGTYAKVGNLEGTAEETFSYRSSTREDGALYYSELKATGSIDRNLPFIGIASELPSSPEVTNVREAEVDLSGVRLMGGVRIRF